MNKKLEKSNTESIIDSFANKVNEDLTKSKAGAEVETKKEEKSDEVSHETAKEDKVLPAELDEKVTEGEDKKEEPETENKSDKKADEVSHETEKSTKPEYQTSKGIDYFGEKALGIISKSYEVTSARQDEFSKQLDSLTEQVEKNTAFADQVTETMDMIKNELIPTVTKAMDMLSNTQTVNAEPATEDIVNPEVEAAKSAKLEDEQAKENVSKSAEDKNVDVAVDNPTGAVDEVIKSAEEAEKEDSVAKSANKVEKSTELSDEELAYTAKGLVPKFSERMRSDVRKGAIDSEDVTIYKSLLSKVNMFGSTPSENKQFIDYALNK